MAAFAMKEFSKDHDITPLPSAHPGGRGTTPQPLEDEMPSAIPRLEELTTELEHRERDIEASRATLRLIVEASRIGIWDWRISDNSLYWNGAMRKLWGYCCEGSLNGTCPTARSASPEDCDRPSFVGTYEGFIAGIAEPDRARVQSVVAHCMKSGEPFSTTYLVEGADGKRRSVDARGSVLFDDHGEPNRMVGICIPLDELRTVDAEG